MARSKTRKAPTKPRTKVTTADLRAELASWTRAELEELALDLLDQNDVARDSVVRKIVANRGVTAAASLFLDQIDAALDVREVTWREVFAFHAKLGRLVDDVRKLGKADPAAAVAVAGHFLERLPAVAECVDGEDELSLVAESLGQVLLEFARPAGLDLLVVAGGLLDAYRADDYGLANTFPAQVAAAAKTESERTGVADLLRGLDPSDPSVRQALEGLARD
ncbi:MAG: hypothetical protein AB7N76_12690 [Planctomycetota bacterium]